ncbi:MAG: amidohydrolase family protein [Deltaproteobacteria bacterium]|nr:amidohydrolase family protein [Deltaproteobacteria bacterium]
MTDRAHIVVLALLLAGAAAGCRARPSPQPAADRAGPMSPARVGEPSASGPAPAPAAGSGAAAAAAAATPTDPFGLLVPLPEPEPPPSGPARFTALVGATVWDGTGRPAIPDAVVLLDRDRIRAVGTRPEVPVPAEATVIDAAGAWIIPGLVDAHVHFFQSAGLYTRPDIIDRTGVRTYAQDAAAIRENLDATFRRYLASGVAAVVDMGGPFWNFEVRDRANATVFAPRVAVAGPLISTVARPQLDLGDPPIIRAASAEDARGLAAAQLARKPDFLKVWFVLSDDRPADEGSAICRAAAEAAHAAGLRLAVHATERATAELALEAGADILVHSVGDEPLDPKFIDQLVERNVIYIPNLVVLEGYGEVLGRATVVSDVERRWGDPDAMRSWGELPEPEGELRKKIAARLARFAASGPIARANLLAVHAAGVTVAAGTDAGNIGTLHGPSLHRELELLAEAGLSPEAVLLAATRDAARVFSATPESGTMEPGRLADLLVLEADPLADVRNARRIRWVVHGGIVVRPEQLIDPNPESVVQEQLDAYNARDLERFVATYAPDAVVLRLPAGEVLARGAEQLRETYGKLFSRNPGLRATAVQRTVEGPWVVDHELVVGIADRPYLHAVAIYRVERGLIRAVWLGK